MTDGSAWFESLPKELRGRAYIAGDEPAWNQEDALVVIEWADHHGLKIQGVEVWLATIPGPTIPGPYTWTSSTPHSQGADSVTSTKSATEFIRTFHWHPNDRSSRGREPYFNLTFG